MSNVKYTFVSPRRQLFSFPSDVISSMLENPSSHKGLLKLYQTCKYFYGKRPILIVESVKLGKDCITNYEKSHVKFCMNGTFRIISNLHIPIWLTSKVEFHCFDQRIPNFFRYSVNYIISTADSGLHYDDFVLLTSEKEVSTFRYGWFCGWVYHPDGSKVSIYEVLQHLPNIKDFSYFIDKQCTPEMLKSMIDIKLNYKFETFELCIEHLNPSFDFNLLFEFITENSNANTNIHIFPSPAAKEETKRAFQKLDPKWKTCEVNEGLKRLFSSIDPDWNKEN